MMLDFYKYHGTGNDFIILDNRAGQIKLTQAQIAHLCHRRYGIGADGLMLLEEDAEHDFCMRYYNADGAHSSMCGNGGRCLVAFAKTHQAFAGQQCTFSAVDGLHTARITKNGEISLQMQDVREVKRGDGFVFLDTGSPHHILWVPEAAGAPVEVRGREIRMSAAYQPGGTNVNFVEILAEAKLYVRTYERGVEAETLSCGTGVVAAAIAASCTSTGAFDFSIVTPGGNLRVQFVKATADMATSVWLTGPAVRVYAGLIEITG